MGSLTKTSGVLLLLARSVRFEATRTKPQCCLAPARNYHFLHPAAPCVHAQSRPFSITKSRAMACRIPRMCNHYKARCEVYPRSELKRCPVKDKQVVWDAECPEYKPVEHTSKGILDMPPWADTEDASKIDAFNTIDQSCNVDRTSFMGQYELDNGRPRNPIGRTGITGRGILGRWGPNHAADPIVTRWKRDAKGKVVVEDGKPVLQFVSVQRRDNGEWALPGGMVNPGEKKTVALMREFGEEALNSLEATGDMKEQIEKTMEANFKNGVLIYEGYVDDPRNTDNAWMETVALHYHDEEGNGLGAFNLNAGDDAVGVQWMDINGSLKLYASHIEFIKASVERVEAHW